MIATYLISMISHEVLPFFLPEERQQRLAQGRLSLARRKAAEAQEVSEAPALSGFGELVTISNY